MPDKKTGSSSVTGLPRSKTPPNREKNIPAIPPLFPKISFCIYFVSSFERWRFLTLQKTYVENAPTVFFANGFSQLHSRKNGKKHAARHVEKNFIEDNVKNGTFSLESCRASPVNFRSR